MTMQEQHAGSGTGQYSTMALGEIAAQLPGSTAVLRSYKLDFCCGGGKTLAEAAAERTLPLARIEAELDALDAGAATDYPDQPLRLIDHILQRYHEVHRRELPELIRLATRVEARHKDHPQVPLGLAALLREMADELESHMQKEEQVLFPLMRAGGAPMIGHPIAQMRHEHDEHGERLRAIEALTGTLTAPADACPTWLALTAGLRKLVDDLMTHIHLENNVLFPQYAAAAAIES
ncbi:MAG: iron-sulfur cluster repair protein YtfE [Nevskiales bacterium]|nr:iron-sulfur cluster repair protein YtfE [Nevskiales bacterium]